MKAVRIAALGVALVVGSAAVASAQGAAPAPQQQGGGMGRGGRNALPPDITLSEEQKAKLDTIQKKYQPELTKIREEIQAGGDRAELMKKSTPIREKMSTEIRAILTADQQVIYDKFQADMKARMEARARP
jgi:Spy/CpxP family protein refolding chaperone